MVLTVHELQLEPTGLKQLQREQRPHLWVSIDPLGLGDELDLQGFTSNRVHAIHQVVNFEHCARLRIEPSEPIWEPITEALRSEEEQDSDVYFVIRAGRSAERPDADGVAAVGGDADGVECGTAHINLEELQRKGHELTRERLPIVGTDGRLFGHLVVTVRALAAMRFASSRLADGADRRLSMDVGVGELALTTQTIKRLEELLDGGRKVRVDVELPPGVRTAPLTTRKAKLSKGKCQFRFASSVDVQPGTAGHVALQSALEEAARTRAKREARAERRGRAGAKADPALDDEPDEAELVITLVAAGSSAGERDRELGSGAVSLLRILEEGRDVESTEVEVRRDAHAATTPMPRPPPLRVRRVAVGTLPEAPHA